MASYEIIERWDFEKSDDPGDKSRKEVQIVRNQDHGRISVRTAYYGPSGRYGQDAPTFNVGEETQQDLIEALQEAFPQAREIRSEESNFGAEELQKLTQLAEQAGGVEQLEEQLD